MDEKEKDPYRANPNGKYPICKPKLVRGRTANDPLFCERCGNQIDRSYSKHCPAVPDEKRWGDDEQI